MSRLVPSRSLIKLLFLVILLVAGSRLFQKGKSSQIVELDVVEGMTAAQVGKALSEKGVIQSLGLFKVWVRVRRAGSRLKVGRYRFAMDRSSYWIVDDLVNARTYKVKVLIPEGFASWQIADRLQEQEICNGEAFKALVKNQDLEGFLFPATYDFDVGLKPESVAAQMKARFDQEWTLEMDKRAAELNLTKKEVVALASIVEREARVRDEQPRIASVYVNRLRKRMRLEADPTVQYALGYWKNRLTYHDYRSVNSPYNTYIHGGLPPGPICSPGADAIQAALWPATTDSLYFLAREDGTHDFSSNYRDHANKVNRRNLQKRKIK